MTLKQHILKSMILVTCDESDDTFYIKEIAHGLFAVESTSGGENYAYGVVYNDICEAMEYIKQKISIRNFIDDFFKPVSVEPDPLDELPF